MRRSSSEADKPVAGQLRVLLVPSAGAAAGARADGLRDV